MASLALIPLVTLSCERRALSVMKTSMQIDLDNDYCLPFEPASSLPQHYKLDVYEPLGGGLVYDDFVPEQGGGVKSMHGDYCCLLLNFDTENMLVTGDDNMSTFHVTFPPADEYYSQLYSACRSKLAELTPEGGLSVSLQRELSTPQPEVLSIGECLWTWKGDLSIPPLAEEDTVFVVKAGVKPSMKQGRVTLNGIKGSEYIDCIDCYVTNLSAGINPLTGALDGQAVTQTFTLSCDATTAQGTFLCFGLAGSQDRLLYVLVTDTGGGRHLYVFDLKELKPDTEMDYTIDTGIDIPKPEVQGGSGGFRPSVGEWNVEYVIVEI